MGNSMGLKGSRRALYTNAFKGLRIGRMCVS